MLSVVQLSTFTRRLKRRLSDEAYRRLEDHLARNPEAGALVPGAGGIRKIRWADEHRGKSGGVRVVYYHHTTMSKRTSFERLQEAVGEMIAIEKGEATPAVEHVYDGPVLVEVREHGEVAWRLAEAGVTPTASDPRAIREGLRQTQEGMAALLGVPLATIRNWDQKRRAPRGPAARLLKLAAKHPGVLLDLD